MINWSRVPLLATAAILCFGGAFRIHQSSGEADGYGLMSAGLIILGIWVTLEILSYGERKRHNDKDHSGDNSQL
jgi:hypothetical protein